MDRERARVRPAIADDAQAACRVLRRSITELCRADHRDDPAVLAPWLANKTPESVAAWIADPRRHVVVAVSPDDRILGVGMAGASGRIELNYVSPDARFRGVSRAVLDALETWLRAAGHDRSRLVSTATAARFYRSRGYRPDGQAEATLGVASQPMVKCL